MTGVENRPPRLFLNEHCSISFRQEKHSNWTNEGRTDYGLVFLFAGSLRFETENAKGEIQPGHFLLVNPGSSEKFTILEATVISLEIRASLMVDCSVRTGLWGTTSDIRLRASEVLVDQAITRLTEDLARELVEADRGHEAVIAALVEQVTIHLLRRYSTFRRSDSLELSRVGLIDRRIRRAVELMVGQLDQELSLKDLAAASYLSPFHFARLFKKLSGTTPHAYLAALRTTTAQKLLAETDLSITEISARVGYASPSHFSRSFRQATGLTPRAFRTSVISRNRQS